MSDVTVRKADPPKTVLVDRGDVLQVVVPRELTYIAAADYCLKKAKEEDTVAGVSREFPCLPWSGAHALGKVLGSYSAVRKDDARELRVPCASGHKNIVWGGWALAGLGDVLQSASVGQDGFVYRVTANFPRKFNAEAERLLDALAVEIAKRELYAGGAVTLAPDENGQLIVTNPPRFVELPAIDLDDLILPTDLMRAVVAELLLPIEEPALVEKACGSARRGILLAGRPGTGKTLACRLAARRAAEAGWAVFYLPDARAIEAALRVAVGHAPALLICEDIDRQLSRKRDAMVDRILNALDGLDRSARVVFVATTNDASGLPAPLLRPGRLDSVMLFREPDAAAAERLLRKYLGPHTPDHLNGAGAACAGLLPASIREVASRSILHALAAGRERPDPEDVQVAAMGVKEQQRALERAERPDAPPVPAIRVLGAADAEPEARAVAALAQVENAGDEDSTDKDDG